MIKFVIERELVEINKNIVSKGCTSISFRNKSDGKVYINGEELGIGETMADNGEPMEQNMTQYKVLFDAACTVKKVFIRRKMYLK